MDKPASMDPILQGRACARIFAISCIVLWVSYDLVVSLNWWLTLACITIGTINYLKAKTYPILTNTGVTYLNQPLQLWTFPQMTIADNLHTERYGKPPMISTHNTGGWDEGLVHGVRSFVG